jgi:hypothetical protein
VPVKFEVFKGSTASTDIAKVKVTTQKLSCQPDATQDAIEAYALGETSRSNPSLWPWGATAARS